MFRRLTAQRLLVERGETDIVPGLVDLVRGTNVDKNGLNGCAVHALWTLHGLAAISGNVVSAVVDALMHPASGVRKAALAVLPRTASSLVAIRQAGLLGDADLNVRLAAFLAVSEMPQGDSTGAELFRQSKRPEVVHDVWLPEALFIAVARHRDGFLDAFVADIGALEFTRLIGRLAAAGLATERIDWSASDLDTSDWDTMVLPMPWVKTDALTSFDGAVWFRTEVDLRMAAGSAILGLGPIYDSDEVFVNGSSVGETLNGYDMVRLYRVPEGVLRSERNVVAVRVDDPRGRGGFWGTSEQLYLRAGGIFISLAKTWQFKVEEEYVGGKRSEISARTPLAEQFMQHHLNMLDVLVQSTPARQVEELPLDYSLSVIPGALQFDKTLLTVPAGRWVNLRFSNPGDMPHNAVFTEPCAAEPIGLRAEKEAASGMYVPDTSAVLFATGLAAPGSEVLLEFRAPATPGDYPFLCTYPGHWRLMQGVMQVHDGHGQPIAFRFVF